MTTEMSTSGSRSPLTSVEDPEAPQGAHPAVAARLGGCQKVRRQPRLPFQDRGGVDAAQHREEQPDAQAAGREAERSVEVDDAGRSVLADQDVVPLAQVDVRDPATVDRVDQAIEASEHHRTLTRLQPAPARNPFALDALHQHAPGAGFAVAGGDARDALQPRESADLAPDLAPAKKA